jgi:DNA-binding beta-propeller fold protein YncE
MRTLALFLVVLLLAGCGGTDGAVTPETRIVVVNRGGGSLSIIDPETDLVVQTVELPMGEVNPLPGYVVYSPLHQRLYVGDEANDRILIYRGSDFSLVGEMPVPSDAFHMWHNDTQLWVVDRKAASLAVFNLWAGKQVIVIPIPADLQAAGGSPHDVVVDADHAYVSIGSIQDAPDVVIKYSTQTFREVGRATVGDDPHVFLHPTDRRLCVACQDTDDVHVLDRDTMATEAVIPIFGGHGVWIPPSGRTLYVTNFPSHIVGGEPGPGADGLFVVDLDGSTAIGGVPTPNAGPHNLTSTADGRKLYLTHTDGGTKVSVYDLATPTSLPVLRTEIEVGENPFGICRME